MLRCGLSCPRIAHYISRPSCNTIEVIPNTCITFHVAQTLFHLRTGSSPSNGQQRRPPAVSNFRISPTASPPHPPCAAAASSLPTHSSAYIPLSHRFSSVSRSLCFHPNYRRKPCFNAAPTNFGCRHSSSPFLFRMSFPASPTSQPIKPLRIPKKICEVVLRSATLFTSASICTEE